MPRRHRIEFAPAAERDFRALLPAVQRRLRPIIDALANDPRPHGCEKLTDKEDLYRVRSGNYRVVYEVRDAVLVILVVRIGHRREVYRER